MVRESGVTSKGERMVPISTVDAMVRARLAEIGAAAGVAHSRVGVEVLYKLPTQLVVAYELLWDLCMYGEGSAEVDGVGGAGRGGQIRAAEVGVAGDPQNKGGGGGGRTRDTERSRERMGEVVVRSGGSSRRAGRGAARGSRGRAAGAGGSWEVQEIKARADKRLRALARDICAELGELGVGVDLGSGEMMVRVRSPRGNLGDAIDDAIDEALPRD